jgi:hypothetical protein
MLSSPSMLHVFLLAWDGLINLLLIYLFPSSPHYDAPDSCWLFFSVEIHFLYCID